MPGIGDVFVVGGNTIYRLTGAPDGSSSWTQATVGPSKGNTSALSGLAPVATSTNNLDLFYFDLNLNLQHIYLAANQAYPYGNNWAVGPSTGVVGQYPLFLSAVPRSQNNIDVASPCATGLCDVSIAVSGTYPGPAPAISSALAINPSAPFSIVAATSFALDLVTASGWTAYDVSWQTGASSWAMTGPVPARDAIPTLVALLQLY